MVHFTWICLNMSCILQLVTILDLRLGQRQTFQEVSSSSWGYPKIVG